MTVLVLVASLVLSSQVQAAEKSPAATGTYIHVKNATNKTLSFSLYVECVHEGTGKFDKEISLEPGAVGMWKLETGHKVATFQKDGKTCYRVGLVGQDHESGKKHQWGVVGSDGMFGKEKTSETEDAIYRNIVVQPMGSL